MLSQRRKARKVFLGVNPNKSFRTWVSSIPWFFLCVLCAFARIKFSSGLFNKTQHFIALDQYQKQAQVTGLQFRHRQLNSLQG